MAEIIVDKVTKRFPDGSEAVKSISLTIKDGEFFILVGPSGCGKSTLLNMIVGLEDITEGEIRVGGQVVNALDPKDRNMAMVFQSYAIYPHMTVRENIAFPLKLAKRSKEEITRRVEKTAATLSLTELLDRKPASLSGGQRQRVAMGRAIIREPQVFLLDEPLSNLDAKLRVQMRTELARLQKRLGITAIYVTHDQSEAMTLGDRVAILRQGEMQQIAPPREIYTAPHNLFVAGFMGSPAMNFFPAKLEDHRLILPMVSFELPTNARGDLPPNLIAGIRPEHIQEAVPPPGNQGSFSPAFKAAVDVIEWMGADVYAYLKIQGEVSKQLSTPAQDLPVTITQDESTPFIARLDPLNHPNEGAELEMQLDISKLHLFDIGTGESLLR